MIIKDKIIVLDKEFANNPYLPKHEEIAVGFRISIDYSSKDTLYVSKIITEKNLDSIELGIVVYFQNVVTTKSIEFLLNSFKNGFVVMTQKEFEEKILSELIEQSKEYLATINKNYYVK